MTIFINNEALKKIYYEVKKSKAVETGGILLGITLNTGDILITHAIEPGPNAVKKSNEFQKDYDYSLRMLTLLYKKYSVDYIGEWHKHPNNCVNYSKKDHASMLKITKINSLPCFFIIVGTDFTYRDGKYLSIYSVDRKNDSIIRNEYVLSNDVENIAYERGVEFSR